MIPTHAAALFYIGVFGLFLVAISVRVSLLRRRHSILLGTGGNPELERARRAQANFAEYTPIFLLVLAGLAYANEPDVVIHILGILFLIGRVAHAWAMTRQGPSHLKGRLVGMTLTYLLLIVASLLLIADALTESAVS
jgi:hypothetical protein